MATTVTIAAARPIPKKAATGEIRPVNAAASTAATMIPTSQTMRRSTRPGTPRTRRRDGFGSSFTVSMRIVVTVMTTPSHGSSVTKTTAGTR